MGGGIFYEQTLIDVRSASGIANDRTPLHDEQQNGRKNQTLQYYLYYDFILYTFFFFIFRSYTLCVRARVVVNTKINTR